ncbi:MAG TPA: permease prefix domain 1-containing protein, partial [Blastocatellia bacterium]|nr:permease prefix domain 1-containing protein [Blastocatellia bacterium]
MNIRRMRGWVVRAGELLGGEKREREFAEEIESHLQMHIEDNVRAGQSAEEARRQALIRLGGVEPTKERYRRQKGLPMVEGLLRDMRYGLRMLARTPGFTAIAVVSLALGIGANTAIFSLVNAALLRPLPVERPEQMVSLTNTAEARMFPTFSYPNYKDIRDRNDVFSGLIAYRFAPLSLSYDGVNERLWGYLVSGNYFDVLGVKAARGRMISEDDDRLP